MLARMRTYPGVYPDAWARPRHRTIRFPCSDEGHAKALALANKVNRREGSRLRAYWYVAEVSQS